MNIRKIINRHFEGEPDSAPHRECLSVTDIGYHPWHAKNRILHGVPKSFDLCSKKRMSNGVWMEEATMSALATQVPMRRQFPLFNDIWRGYADAVLDHGTIQPTILEHKFTGDKWFNYKNSLPRLPDVLQIWMYGELYRESWGETPRLILYYKSHGHELESKIHFVDGKLLAEGQSTTYQWNKLEGGYEEKIEDQMREFDTNPNILRNFFEEQFVNDFKDVEPDGSDDFDWALNWFALNQVK